MVRNLICLLILGTLGVAAVAQPGSTRPDGRKTSRRVNCVVVAGDLDTARVAHEIDTHLHQAGEAHADTFVLELAGDRWRTDVIHQIAASLRAATVRTVVWLRDTKGHSVGIGQAVLGLVATECWIEPGTHIEQTENDDRRQLAPKGTDHDKLADELMRWAGENQTARGFDPLLPRLMLGEPMPMWGVGDAADAPLRISPVEPITGPTAPARAIPLTRQAPGQPIHVLVDSEAAVGVGLARGQATYLIDLFEHRGVRPSASGTSPISVNLDRILEHAAEFLDALDRELEAIETELASKPRDKRINTQGFYRDLGARVLKRTAAARAQLEKCEQLLIDDPEIARTPPPGGDRHLEPDQQAAAWRSAFKERRNHVARLEKKARVYTNR